MPQPDPHLDRRARLIGGLLLLALPVILFLLPLTNQVIADIYQDARLAADNASSGRNETHYPGVAQ